MNRICLDTSAYSNFRRGEPGAVEHLDRAAWIGVPSVVVGELSAGFLLGRRAHENFDALGEFLFPPPLHHAKRVSRRASTASTNAPMRLSEAWTTCSGPGKRPSCTSATNSLKPAMRSACISSFLL